MSSCPSAASRLPICSRSLTAARLPLLQDEPLSSQLQPCRLVGGSGGRRRHSVTLACLRSVVRFGQKPGLMRRLLDLTRFPTRLMNRDEIVDQGHERQKATLGRCSSRGCFRGLEEWKVTPLKPLISPFFSLTFSGEQITHMAGCLHTPTAGTDHCHCENAHHAATDEPPCRMGRLRQ